MRIRLYSLFNFALVGLDIFSSSAPLRFSSRCYTMLVHKADLNNIRCSSIDDYYAVCVIYSIHIDERHST